MPTESEYVNFLKTQLEAERKAAEIREDVVRDLMNRVDAVKSELMETKEKLKDAERSVEFQKATLNSIKTLVQCV